VGGSYRLRRFQFDLELPSLQHTVLDLVSPNMLFVILPEDAHQTTTSIGDLRFGAQWTERMGRDHDGPIAGGFSLRVRLPTHTTTYRFHLQDGTIGTYLLPYYVHIEPAALFAATWGPLAFTMNQGGIVLVGPDGDVAGLPIVVPTIYFWDAHYALACAMGRYLAASVEFDTTIQLNTLDPVMYPNLSHLKALSIVPALQVHAGTYRIDALARFGLNRAAEAFGVIAYSGKTSFILRVSRDFD